jgi:uncharacterized membrane protein
MAMKRSFPTVREMVDQTPPSRDRVIDLVRGAALCFVVAGHALMAEVAFVHGKAVLSNTLVQTPWLQSLTWVLQIMPLFFAAGAYVNVRSYENGGETYSRWLQGRVRRLLRPVFPYVIFWIIASPFLLWWNNDIALPLLRISTQLLWFLGAYLLVVATTPILARGAKHPVLATGAWLTAVAAVDLIRLGGGPNAVGLLNFWFGWCLAAQTGLWVFDATRRPRPAVAAVGALGFFAANLALVGFGPWPRSMVGLPGERISNMAPPSLALGMHAVTLAFLVAALYPLLVSFTHNAKVWYVAVAVNSSAMTLYLWHLVALVLAVLVVYMSGYDLVGYEASRWWIPRGIFWLTFIALTFVFVRTLRPLEFIKLPWWDAAPVIRAEATPRWKGAISIVGVIITSVGILALSVTGLVGFPFNSGVSYAGFKFTPGIAIIVTLVGLTFIRAAAAEPDDGPAWTRRMKSTPEGAAKATS